MNAGTDMSKPARVVHDQVVELIGVELQPGHCQTIVDSLLSGYVPADEPEKAYDRGVQDTLDKAFAVGPAIQALREAQDLLRACRAWQGTEEWRDEQVSHINDLIQKLS